MEGTIKTSASAQHVTMMLLGSTGAGKSASGNTILNRARNPFEEGFSPEAVTRTCQSGKREVDGQIITVIDTVGLSDTEVRVTDAQTQIEEMLQRTKDGIDVFLLVIKLGENFRKNEIKVVTWIRENFGANALKHTLVLFTHGDQLHGTVERYLTKCGALRSVVDQCSGRFQVLDNKDKDPSQVTELLEKVNKLRWKNSFRSYTEQDYKKAQEDLLSLRCSIGVGLGALVGCVMGTVAGVIIGVTAEAIALFGEVAFTARQLSLIGAAGGAFTVETFSFNDDNVFILMQNMYRQSSGSNTNGSCR